MSFLQLLKIYIKSCFDLISKTFFSDNANKIAKNKVFVSLKLHAKNMSIFFPHNLNRVKKDFYLNLLGLMKYLPKNINNKKV